MGVTIADDDTGGVSGGSVGHVMGAPKGGGIGAKGNVPNDNGNPIAATVRLLLPLLLLLAVMLMEVVVWVTVEVGLPMASSSCSKPGAATASPTAALRTTAAPTAGALTTPTLAGMVAAAAAAAGAAAAAAAAGPSSSKVVRAILEVTMYKSQLAAGRRSSK